MPFDGYDRQRVAGGSSGADCQATSRSIRSRMIMYGFYYSIISKTYVSTNHKTSMTFQLHMLLFLLFRVKL